MSLLDVLPEDQKPLAGEQARLTGSVLNDARPGAFDATEVAGEFREVRCGGIGADGLAGAVEIKAAHFVEWKQGYQFESGR